MKYIILLAFCFSLIGCSSISQEDKDLMCAVATNQLKQLYTGSPDVTPFSLKVTSDKIEKGDSHLGVGEYNGLFTCKFTNMKNDHEITLFIVIDFDKNKRIATMPEMYGKDKLAIEIMHIIDRGKNIENVESKDVNQSIYVLDCFNNRNNFNTNK